MTDLIFRLDSLDEAFHFANAYDKVRNQVPGGHGINVVGSSALDNFSDGESHVWKVILATDGPKTLMALSAHLHAEMPSEFFSAAEHVEEAEEPYTENHASNFPGFTPPPTGTDESESTEPSGPDDETDDGEDEDTEEDDEETAGSSSEVTRVRRKRPPITMKGRNPAITIEKTD